MAAIRNIMSRLEGKDTALNAGPLGFLGNILQGVQGQEKKDEPELDPKEKGTRKKRRERIEQRQTAINASGGGQSQKLG